MGESSLRLDNSTPFGDFEAVGSGESKFRLTRSGSESLIS